VTDTDDGKPKRKPKEDAGVAESLPFLPMSLYDVAFDGLDFNTLERLMVGAMRDKSA
jgi:hypothetical protein